MNPTIPVPTETPEARYLIRKGGAYYRPNSQGYTLDPAEAGRFTLSEAESITHPNGPDGSRDGLWYVPAPTSFEDTDTRLPRLLALPAERQHEIADRLAANLGMMLVNEPEHPDAPGPGGFERAAEAAFARSGTDTVIVTADDYRAASPALASPVPSDARVKIKPLEWTLGRCDTAFGSYSMAIMPSTGRVQLLIGMSTIGVFDALAKAEDAAQADFESRIRSCLVPSVGMDQEAVTGDWGDEALHTAEEVLRYLGRGYDDSHEPGADRHRDRVCQIIETALVSAKAAERAAHEKTNGKLRMIVGHATAGQTDGAGMSINDICVAITALRNDLWLEARKKPEARIALLEETVETAGKALEPFAKIVEASQFRHLVADQRLFLETKSEALISDDLRTKHFFRAKHALASLTQHKAPALPASDAEGGANG